MSRIGRAPVPIPAKVEVKISGRTVTVKGPLGSLSWEHPECIAVEIKDGAVTCQRSKEQDIALHGTTRALIRNMVVGVSEGFRRGMQIVGTGYRAKIEGKKLVLSVGHSHPVELEIPQGLEVVDLSKKGDEFAIVGADKRQLGEFAAKVRAVRPPEPYKGKGIRYKEEHVRTKQGKKVGA
jgi:large subunit ribosomal protein L6